MSVFKPNLTSQYVALSKPDLTSECVGHCKSDLTSECVSHSKSNLTNQSPTNGVTPIGSALTQSTIHCESLTLPVIVYCCSVVELQIERVVELSSNLAIKEWRRLPSIVSHIHVPLLQVMYACS